MKKLNSGCVFIVSGPSGSGKDTVLCELFKKCPEVKFSISSTTRGMRKGEKEGEKYNFITREKFELMIENQQLLEYNEYVGNYYGTPKSPIINAINKGEDIIIEVDVNGAAKIKEKMPEAVSIFIMPPSFSELSKRLSARGTETESVIKERLHSALDEIKRAFDYEYIIVNDDLPLAVENMISIIKSNHLKINSQKHIIDEVLKNVKS